jgi:hypothetical protein
MFAIRQMIDDPQNFITVPPELRHRPTEVIFIALDQKSELAAVHPPPRTASMPFGERAKEAQLPACCRIDKPTVSGTHERFSVRYLGPVGLAR